MPLWIPTVADLDATLILANANRGYFVHEWGRIGIGHVAADGCRIFRRRFFIRLLKRPGQAGPLGSEFPIQLKFHVAVRFGALLLAHRTMLTGHTMVQR